MKSPPILGLLSALLHDVARLEPDVKGLDRDIVTIKARFEHEGIGFISVALPSLCDSLDWGLATGRFACPSGFRKIRCGALPRIFSGLLCKVFESSTGSLKDTVSPGHVKCLREILRLFKKLKLSDERDENLTRLATRTFWETDRQAESGLCPDSYEGLFSRVAGFCLPNLDTFEARKIVLRHGPGAVCEGLTPNQKWSGVFTGIRDGSPVLSGYGLEWLSSIVQSEKIASFDGKGEFDSISSYRLSHSGPELFIPELQDGLLPVRGNDPLEPLRDELPEVPNVLSSGGCSRLVTVPKNSVSRRTITVEPLLNMYIQQGLNTILRDEILKCRILRQCLDLTDQSKNQHLALIGSRTGIWSTLDLSSASDLLSHSLVKKVFERKPRFLSRLLRCRSAYCLEKKIPKQMAKYAGMGNATTFPVQSITFALIAICAILWNEGTFRPSYGRVLRTARRVRVYGDDIIVPTEHVHQVMGWIESFGLKVNRKKSFYEGNFRESCGVDAYRGYDVTPVYIRADPALVLSGDPSALASYVAASNQAWLKGLYSLSTELRMIVESCLGKLPLVNSQSGALGWHSRVDTCSYQKWDDKLHRLVYKAPVLVSIKTRDKLDGYAALLKSLTTPLISRPVGHLKSSLKRFSVKIVWRWIPTEVG